MAYRVELSRAAQADIVEYSDYIANERNDPAGSTACTLGLIETFRLLEKLPQRFPVTPEFRKQTDLRECFYHSHRVIFRIAEETQTVRIARVYHSARRKLKRKDIGSH